MVLFWWILVLGCSAVIGGELGARRGNSTAGTSMGLFIPVLGLMAIPFFRDGNPEPAQPRENTKEWLSVVVTALGFLVGSATCLILWYSGMGDLFLIGLPVTLGVWFISGVTVVACNWRVFFPGKQQQRTGEVPGTVIPLER